MYFFQQPLNFYIFLLNKTQQYCIYVFPVLHIHSFTYFSMACELHFPLKLHLSTWLITFFWTIRVDIFILALGNLLSCSILDHWILPWFHDVSLFSFVSILFCFLSQFVFAVSFFEGFFRICHWPLFSSCP